MRPDFIPVGAVVNAHGIRGEVKVNPAGFDPEFIASFKTLYIGGQPVKVISARVINPPSCWPCPASPLWTMPWR